MIFDRFLVRLGCHFGSLWAPKSTPNRPKIGPRRLLKRNGLKKGNVHEQFKSKPMKHQRYPKPSHAPINEIKYESPMNPGRQLYSYEPSVSMHWACPLHLWLLDSHSFILMQIIPSPAYPCLKPHS